MDHYVDLIWDELDVRRILAPGDERLEKLRTEIERLDRVTFDVSKYDAGPEWKEL